MPSAHARALAALICLLSVLAVLGGGAATASAGTVSGTKVYFSTGGNIKVAEIDGTGLRTLIPSEGEQIADVTVAGGYIYWSTGRTFQAFIGRAKLDGTDIQRAWLTDQTYNGGFFVGISTTSGLTTHGDYIYWMDYGRKVIGRAKLDGTQITPAFATIPDTGGFAIAVNDTHIYWAATQYGRIGRMKLDGTAHEDNLIFGNAYRGLALTDANTYWTQKGASAYIARANLDGTSPNLSYKDVRIAGDTPDFLSLLGTDLYFSTSASMIRRLNLGTLVQTNVLTSSGGGAITGLAVAPPTATLTLDPASITATGSSSTTARLVAKDVVGGPVTGDTVAFTASGGQVVGPVTESPPGTYSATITSTSTPGTATITATDTSASPNVSVAQTLTQTAYTSPASQVVVALSPASITADGSSTTTATATVTDPSDNPVSGDAVTFTSSRAGQIVSATTPGAAAGTYKATITSTATPGDVTITATDTSASPVRSGTATLTQTKGTPIPSGIDLKLTPSTIAAGGAATSTAKVTISDQYGDPVVGDTVAITSSGAQSIGGVTAGQTPGTYEATITPTSVVGTATITARDSTPSTPLTKTAQLSQVVGDPTQVSLSFNPPTIVADGVATTRLTATLKGANGDPVTGHVVQVTSSGAQAIGPVTENPNAPGQYGATITASTVAGPATITVTDTTASPPVTRTTTLTQKPGPARTMVVTVSPTSIRADGTATATATATISDANGNLIDGEPVVFSATGLAASRPGGGTGFGATRKGAADGSYQADYTATTTAGEVTVHAFDGATDAQQLERTTVLTQTAGAADSVKLTLSPASIVADGVTTTTATAVVKDDNGNPLTGEAVTFASSGTQQVGTVSEPTPGSYRATVRSTTTAGTAIITATDSTPPTPKQDSATLTQVAGVAKTVEVVLAPATIVAERSSTSKATITVTDVAGNPVSGHFLTLSSTGGQLVSGVTAAAAAGTYEATIHATRVAGTSTVTATDLTADPNLTGSTVLTQTPARATNVSLVLSPASIAANGRAQTTATVTVTDRDNDPVSGDTVTVTPSGGQAVSTVTAGAQPGTYEATITSTTTVGTSTITATDTTADPDVAATAPLTQTRVQATQMDLTLAPASISADGRSTSIATAVVKDAQGFPVAGDDVRILSTGSQAISAVTEPKPGTYQVTVTSTRERTTVSIYATDHTPSTPVFADKLLRQTAPPAATVTVELTPSSIIADGAHTSTAIATVTDTEGDPVQGDTVTFTSSGTQQLGVTQIGPRPGTYQTTVISTRQAGTATITATDSSSASAPHGEAVLTQVAGPATTVTLALSPSSITADGVSTSTATATVADQFANPVLDDAVALSSTGLQVVGLVTHGAAPGTYQATIQSTTRSGSATITATDGPTQVKATKILTQTPGAVTHVGVTLIPSSIVADRTSSTEAEATALDRFENAVPGETITFASDGGQHIGTVRAGTTPGARAVTIDATTTPGTATITATDTTADPDIDGRATLTQTARQAQNLALTLAPAAVPANGRTSTTATLTITDRNGDPIDGEAVTITASGGQVVGPVRAGSASGVYEATITATRTPGTATITATDTTADPDAIKTAVLTQTRLAPTAVALDLSPATVRADGTTTSTATATVTDLNGDPVVGDDVRITSSGAQAITPVSPGTTPGTYVATITSTKGAGTATITASDVSPATPVFRTAPLTQVAGPADSVGLALEPSTITADGRATTKATATIVDVNGNPVTGDDVTITSSGDQVVSSVSPGPAPGTYVATITATRVAGTAEITATDTSLTARPAWSRTLTQAAGPPVAIDVTLSPATLTADGTSTATALATVADADGNPISGRTVTFATTGGQAIGPVTAGSAPGTYQATVTATRTAGTATITARDAAAALAKPVTLTQTAGPATSVAVALTPRSIAADTTSTTTAIATVTDANANLVPAQDVTFATDGAQLVSSTRAGTAPGRYEATITASGSIGNVAVTATDTTPAPDVSGTAVLRQTAGPATAVQLLLSPSSIKADGRDTTQATITVTDGDARPAEDQVIELTSTGGQRVGPVTESATLGEYRATITASTSAGSATLRATVTSAPARPTNTAELTQTAGAVPIDEAAIVWTDDNAASLERTTLDAGMPAKPIGPSGRFSRLASDGSYVYWTDPATGNVGRAVRNGGNPNAAFLPGVEARRGIAVDGTHVYWANASASAIGRARLDGTDVQPTFIAGVHSPDGVAVSGGLVFWSSAQDDAIGRARDDGSQLVHSFVAGTDAQDVAADDTHVYWTTANGAVARATLAGTAKQVIVPSAGAATGIGLDRDSVLWVHDGDRIGRAGKDGQGVRPDFITGAPRDVAVVGGASITLGPASIVADGRSTSVARSVTADAFGNPVDGPAPRIQSSKIQPVSATTHGPTPGTWEATVRSTITPGTATISAFGPGLTEPRATLTQTEAPASSMTLTLSPRSILGDGTATSTATAVLTDAAGTPLSGETVTFGTSSFQGIGAVTEPTPGTYRATITASPYGAGTASITATATSVAGSPAATQTLTQTKTPDRISVAVTPDFLAANGTSQTVATATITDQFGQPIADLDVSADAVRGLASVGAVTPGATAGTYTATVTSKRDQTGGETIRFTTTANGRQGTAALFLGSADPVAPDATITAPTANQKLTVGQAAQATFTCAEGAGGPGLVSCRDTAGRPSPATIDTARPGLYTYTVVATSRNGLTGRRSVDYEVVGPPTVTVVGREGSFVTGGDAYVRYTCADAASGPGIAKCGYLPNGGDPAGLPDCADACNEGRVKVDTSREGTFTFRIGAVSRNGQRAVVDSSYTIGATPLVAEITPNRFSADLANAGKDEGTITWRAGATGGTAPYSYVWSTTAEPGLGKLSTHDGEAATFTPTAAANAFQNVVLTVRDARGRVATGNQEFVIVDNRTPTTLKPGGTSSTSLNSPSGTGKPGSSTSTDDCQRKIVIGSAEATFDPSVPKTTCFEPSGDNWKTGAALVINNISFGNKGTATLDPEGGEIRFTDTTARVCNEAASKTCSVKAVPLKLFGALTIDNLLDEDETNVEFGSAATKYLGLDLAGAEVTFGEVKKGTAVEDATGSDIQLRVKLPALKVGDSASSGDITTEIGLEAGNYSEYGFGYAQVKSAFIRVEEAFLKSVEVNDVCFSYNAASANGSRCPFFQDTRGAPFMTCGNVPESERFAGTMDVSFGGIGPKFSASVADGQLASLGVGLNLGHKVRLGAGPTFLRFVAAGICLKPYLKVKGGATVGVLPRGAEDDAKDVVSVYASLEYSEAHRYWESDFCDDTTLVDVAKRQFGAALDCHQLFPKKYKVQGRTTVGRPGYEKVGEQYSDQPWEARLDGSVFAFEEEIGGGYLSVNGRGTVAFGAHIDKSYGPASLKGSVDGFFETRGASPGFNIEGRVVLAVDLGFAEPSVGVTALASSKGIAACLDYDFWIASGSAGFGHTWGGGTRIMLTGCDVGGWRVYPSTRSLRANGTLPPSGVTVAPGQPALVMRVRGATAAPRVKLTGPDGRIVQSPAIGVAAGEEHQYLMTPDPDGQGTIVLVNAPAPGRWTVEPLDPGPITAIDTQDRLPTPEVSAKVTKAKSGGRQRVLAYRYVPQPNLEVRFVEQGGPDRVSGAVGMATPGACPRTEKNRAARCGTLRFTPSQGAPGARRVVAQISRGAMPLANRYLTSYRAPGAAVPGVVRRVRIVRGASRVTVVWGKAVNAKAYRVTVETTGGQHIVKTTTAGCRAMRVSGVATNTVVVARVNAIDADKVAGKTTVRTLGRHSRAAGGKRVAGDGRCRR